MPNALPFEPRALTGILYMIAAVSLFPLMNATVKYLGNAGYPVGEVIWARYVGHFVWAALFFMPRGGVRILRTARPGLQLLRSALLFSCTAVYFIAIQHLDLTMAAAISFTSPIIVTALSVPMLGEQVGIRRWIAVVVGFAGALLVIRPGGDSFHWAMLLVAFNAFAYAFYQLLTRKAASEPPETSMIWSAIVGAVVASFLLIDGFELPRTAWHWVLFLSMGFIGGIGHYFVVKAFQHATVAVVTPFSYFQLVGATTLGFFIFGDIPDRWTWVGASIIVGSGLYITWREQKKKKKA
ncbi:MAG: DMT family transporter [Pseudomonadota bacterium]|nr:DMT family transporter [Pseudomonadota bacterium]